jgi:glutaredoxin-related protein
VSRELRKKVVACSRCFFSFYSAFLLSHRKILPFHFLNAVDNKSVNFSISEYEDWMIHVEMLGSLYGVQKEAESQCIGSTS